MKEKYCIICNELKLLSEFYIHRQMSDGHLNKCKNCTKKQARDREILLRQDLNWSDSEKARHREKYYRLGYKEKHKPSSDKTAILQSKYRTKYPEKYKAKCASQHIKLLTINNHLHHWSYNKEHWKDTIELSALDHYLLHRHIIYDQERMMYRNVKTGILLDTKQSHTDLLKTLK